MKSLSNRLVSTAVAGVVGLGVALVAIGALLGAQGAKAATIDLRAASAINDGMGGTTADICDQSGGGPSLSCSSGPHTTLDGATNEAEASANIVTGELRALATKSGTTEAQSNATFALAEITVFESFLVSGSGFVQILFDVSGSFNITRPIGDPTFQIQARISSNVNSSNFGLGEIDIFAAGTFDPPSLIDELLMVEEFVSNGQTLFIEAFMIVQLLAGFGSIDLSNTGSLFIQMAEGVSLTPSDPLFLSNPAFGSTVVPLPAAFPLFGTGLGILGFLGWRRRRTAQAASSSPLRPSWRMRSFQA